jgi:hypothetical protein
MWKGGRARRKKVNAYVESNKEDYDERLRTAICTKCSGENGDISLIPYKASYGIDKNYLQCPLCHSVIPSNLIAHKSIVGPLGSKTSSSSYEVVTKKRRIDRGNTDVFKVEDYPLAGKIDTDLEFLASQGIVTKIIHSNVEGEGEYEEGFS